VGVTPFPQRIPTASGGFLNNNCVVLTKVNGIQVVMFGGFHFQRFLWVVQLLSDPALRVSSFSQSFHHHTSQFPIHKTNGGGRHGKAFWGNHFAAQIQVEGIRLWG